MKPLLDNWSREPKWNNIINWCPHLEAYLCSSLGDAGWKCSPLLKCGKESNSSGNLQVCGAKYSINVPLFVQVWSSEYKFKASIQWLEVVLIFYIFVSRCSVGFVWPLVTKAFSPSFFCIAGRVSCQISEVFCLHLAKLLTSSGPTHLSHTSRLCKFLSCNMSQFFRTGTRCDILL